MAMETAISYHRALFLAMYGSLVLLFGIPDPGVCAAEPIPARNVQGSMHGFLLLKSTDGKVIAVGDMIQVAHGRHVWSRLVFRFHDGSIDDEATTFLQGRVFHLMSDHHIQKGPSFPKPLDLLINVAASETTSREFKDGTEQVKTEHIDLPDDLANGMVPLVLQNIAPAMQEAEVSYLAGNPKPRLVKLAIKPVGEETFHLDGTSRHAKKYDIKIELGGVAGVIAPVIGKQPSDIQIWVADGQVPTVVKTEGALYEGGPRWIMETAAPVWPQMTK